MKAFRSFAAVAATMAGMAACAPTATMGTMNELAAKRGPDGMRGERPVTLRVDNDNWSDVAVYLVRGSTRTRLGTVTSMSGHTFRLPRGTHATTGDLRLYTQTIGAHRSFLSEPVQVMPGQRVELRVHNAISTSNVMVWN